MIDGRKGPREVGELLRLERLQSPAGVVPRRPIDDLVGEWAMIGPIGEDGPPAASWDILEAKDLLPDSLHSHSRTSSRDGSRPTTPSSSASSSLAERTCAGPFAMRRRNMKKNRPVMWRQPTLSTAAACGAQAAAPAATIDLS